MSSCPGATSSPHLCEWCWGFQLRALQGAACTIPCHPAWQLHGAPSHTHRPEEPMVRSTASCPALRWQGSQPQSHRMEPSPAPW